MSSATNNRGGGLEEAFRHRLQDAEASPSAELWERIDHSLTLQESNQYKRGMLFYRQLAAACIALLLLGGGFAAYYFGGQEKAAPVAQVKPAAESSYAAVVPSGAPVAEGEAFIQEEVSVDELIAQAMQQAVQPQRIYTPEREQNREARATRQQDTAGTLAAAEQPGIANSGAWRIMPGARYSLSSAQKKSVSINGVGVDGGDVRQLFENMRRGIVSDFAAGGKHTSGGSNSMAFSNSSSSPADFKTLSEMVMGRMKQLEAEQEANKQLYKQEKAPLPGQTEANKSSSASGRWSLGMAYAPSYFEQNIGMPSQMMMGAASSFSSFAPPIAMQQSARMVEEAREEHEQEVEPGFSFGVEAKAGFKVGRKWKLLAGLGFTQNTARSKSSYVIEQFWRKPGSKQAESPGATTIFVPSLSSNFASDSLSVTKTDEFNVLYRYRHLTVPLGLQYAGKISKDWFWYASGGVAANILLQTTVLASSAEVQDTNYGPGDDSSPFRKLQWSGNVTAGVGKQLTDQVSVTLGPEYRGYFDTMLSSPEKAYAPQGKPYTLGINLALNYDLGHGRK
ncbi:outer membrane beta-barrel protein [Pontibacter mangrovi]|uniref:PorT family protein n=1 Tax=Pontibacter mangrovi TaxID=2589816 RepID=A0A501W6F4_9BACT|nr:outer membrane beta-barrel protein [Pontibacter mangrovi]TPE44868.1 PorT family protein [Pontibacter mangrovi]